jgi:HAD superfamily hydrolase (TIGR01509 family)
MPKPKPRIKAVIFDMDGTLLDSREFIMQATEAALEAHGVTGVTREHMIELTGKSLAKIYESLAPGYDTKSLMAAHREYQAAHRELLQAYGDTKEILEKLQRQKVKIGLFTGAEAVTYDNLRRFGLSPYFGSIVEASRYENSKPHPEGLLLCMEELGVRPDETVFVGDGIGDMLAGNAAHVHAVIGITHGFSQPDALQGAGADHLIGSLRELKPLLKNISTKTTPV